MRGRLGGDGRPAQASLAAVEKFLGPEGRNPPEILETQKMTVSAEDNVRIPVDRQSEEFIVVRIFHDEALRFLRGREIVYDEPSTGRMR